MLNQTSRTFDTTALAAMLSGFKTSLRITANDMDAELTRELKASALHCETFVGYVLVKSAFTLSCAFAPELVLQGPVLSVTSVTVDGMALDPDEYKADGDRLSIYALGSQVTVQYTAGLAELPTDVEQAIFLRAGYFFNSPVDSVDQLMRASTRLLRPHRLYKSR